MHKLQHLRIGENFEVPALRDTLRNLVVLRPGDCSVMVTGEERENQDSAWHRFTTRFAPTMEVEVTGGFTEVKADEDGQMHAQVVSAIKRGRKAKSEVEFPDGEFKIKELAEKLEIEYHTVMNAFNRVRADFIQVRTEPNGGRGKPVIVWKKKA